MANSSEVHTAFADASGFLIRAIESVPDSDWLKPGLGVWNVRELAVHASRAWLTTLQYTAEPASLSLHRPVDYYLAVLNLPGDLHTRVAETSIEQAASVDDSVPVYASALYREASAVVDNTPDDQVIASLAGGIRLIDYLPSRVLEMVTHGIDIHDALGSEPEVPVSAMSVSLELLSQIAAERLPADQSAGLVRALTGRAPFAGDINLLA